MLSTAKTLKNDEFFLVFLLLFRQKCDFCAFKKQDLNLA